MILVVTLCVFFATFFYLIYKKIYNPCTIFFSLWGVITALSSLGLYGATKPSLTTYFILSLGIIGFGIGFICASRKKTKVVFTIRGNNKNFNQKVKYKYVLNYKIIIFLYGVTLAYLLYQTVTVIGMLNTGMRLNVIRELSTSSEYNILRKSNFMVAIQNFIVTPTVYIAIAILPIEWLKKTGSKWLIITTTIMVVTWVLTTGGRSIIIWFAIYIIYLYMWKGRKIYLKTRTKVLLFIFILICIIGVIVSTKSRKGTEADLFFQLYQYFVVPIAHFEYRIDQINTMDSNLIGFGLASFYGILYPLMFIFSLFGFKYPTFYTEIRNWSFVNLEQVVTLGDVRMNAFVTIFYQLYLDGRLVGVILGSALFGFVVMQYYYKAQNATNEKYTLVFLLLLQKLIFSFVRFYFTQPIQAISFVLAFFVYKKVKLRTDN